MAQTPELRPGRRERRRPLAELTPERRTVLLAYCRIDELVPEEEPVFEVIYQAAVAYMEQAGVPEPEENSPRRGMYDLCVKALVLDSWDRRGTAAEAKSSVGENRSFRLMLNQLKHTQI